MMKLLILIATLVVCFNHIAFAGSKSTLAQPSVLSGMADYVAYVDSVRAELRADEIDEYEHWLTLIRVRVDQVEQQLAQVPTTEDLHFMLGTLFQVTDSLQDLEGVMKQNGVLVVWAYDVQELKDKIFDVTTQVSNEIRLRSEIRTRELIKVAA